MSGDFSLIRSRSTVLLERMLDQLEGKDEFTQFDMNILEKLVKTSVVLETQNAKSGVDTGLRDLSAEDLENAYDGD